MSYAGFYINLDRRPDRQAAIEAELARHGLKDSYRRFAATDGNALELPNPHLHEGEMGCFISHSLVLKENFGSNQHLHIVEDDVLFASCTAAAINWLFAQEYFNSYDIIYTDVLIPLLNDYYKRYKQSYDEAVKHDSAGNIASVTFGVTNLKGLLFGSASSMVINKNSIVKLHDLYAEEIANEPTQSIDLFIRRMSEAGVLKVGCLFPFVTSVRLDQIIGTDIERYYHEMSALAVHLARYSFFVGADLGQCREYIAKFLSLPADPHTQILAQLLAFSLTDKYKAF